MELSEAEGAIGKLLLESPPEDAILKLIQVATYKQFIL
jgi:hypothetical protein